MLLIDRPYVSDFLIRTIQEEGFPVVATTEAKKLAGDLNLPWISERDALNQLTEDPTTPLYTNSENALPWISLNMHDSPLIEQLRICKDKIAFRELIKDSFPDFSFRTLDYPELENLDFEDFKAPFVIKPSVGFFSLGVHIVRCKGDLEAASMELSRQRIKNLFPLQVLDASTFIIEEYVEGEEFAIDCYYNLEGKVVILNILHHKFSSGTDTSDRVYITSRDLVMKYKEKFEDFLNITGDKAGFRNFPAHVEVRLDKQGTIVPIEINPLRFGGFCTTADLAGIALDLNLYSCYQKRLVPDWDVVFKDRSDKIFSIVVLNNNSGIPAERISSFDYDLLARDFENPLEIRRMDFNKLPLFGFIFTETSPDNVGELDQILDSNLKKYIRTS
jgi:hypothetical protein